MVRRWPVGELLEQRGVAHLESAWLILLHFTHTVDIEEVLVEFSESLLNTLKGTDSPVCEVLLFDCHHTE
jgi:hypothetical protein